MTGCWLWWHDLLEMLGAAATAIAVVFGVIGFRRERADRVAAENDRDEARAAARRAETEESRRIREAQARSVAFNAEFFDTPEGLYEVTLQVHNYSSLPVSEVQAFRGPVPIQLDLDLFLGVLAPGEKNYGNDTSASEPERTEYRVRFRDVNGVRWERHLDGTLDEVPDEPSV